MVLYKNMKLFTSVLIRHYTLVIHKEMMVIKTSHIRLVNNNTTFTTGSSKGTGKQYFHTCFTSIHVCQYGNTLPTQFVFSAYTAETLE